MNYRHSFHVAGIADVFKHYVLTLALQGLHAKPAPFCVVDTHAGSGAYRLRMPGEYVQGIARLWPHRRQWPALAAYFSLIEAVNGQGELHNYPGSPLIITGCMRPQDRAVFIELHEDECAALKTLLAQSRNLTVQFGDAWKLLKGFVPPRENRGLVLIDPPFEKQGDFEQIAQSLRQALRHWRQGSYLAWYPVKQQRPVAMLHRAVQEMNVQAWAVEFTTLPTDVEQRMNGSGLIMVNPPWTLMNILRESLPPLAEYLAGDTGRPGVRFVDLASSAAASVS